MGGSVSRDLDIQKKAKAMRKVREFKLDALRRFEGSSTKSN